MRRRLLTTALGVSCCAGLFLLACSSDEDTPGGGSTTGGVDASPDSSTNPGSDGGAKVDSGQPPTDSGSDMDVTVPTDAGDAGLDAGPTRTTEVKATGLIRVGDLYAQARFSEDDTIVRWSHAPQCLTIVRSATKPFSTAGTVTIGGQIVNSDGGTTSVVELNAPDYYYDGVVLPLTSEFTVDISEGPGNPAFPALPTQTIRPSAATPVTINGPLPDAGTMELPVEANKPLTFTWAVPTGDIAEQRFSLDLQFFPSGADGSKNVEVFCDAALSTGTLTIPTELMNDAVAQTLPASGSGAGAALSLFAGGYKVVAIKEALYVITAATDPSTSSPTANLIVK